MSAYTKFPGVFLPVPGTIRYTADRDLVWGVGTPAGPTFVVVPALYEHDVSVPLPLRPFFGVRDPRFQRAARLHDWLLDCGWTPWSAGAVFQDALEADGVNFVQRWAMTQAVVAHTTGPFYRGPVAGGGTRLT